MTAAVVRTVRTVQTEGTDPNAADAVAVTDAEETAGTIVPEVSADAEKGVTRGTGAPVPTGEIGTVRAETDARGIVAMIGRAAAETAVRDQTAKDETAHTRSVPPPVSSPPSSHRGLPSRASPITSARPSDPFPLPILLK